MSPLVVLFLLPIVAALLPLVPRSAKWLAGGSAVLYIGQLGVALAVCVPRIVAPHIVNGDFGIDGITGAFVVITSLVAAAAMCYGAVYMTAGRDSKAGYSDRQFAYYHTLCALFLMAMYGVLLAQNMGYMWIAVELTTLISAPLVNYHRTRRSLEATWKYLLLCSVGIGFALFGTVLFVAAQQGFGASASMQYHTLLGRAHELNPRLVRYGFVFCLLGYGTKAGLFPLHNWLPDAHSEAPAPASAMLSGALLNCALVALWRVSQLVVAAGQGELVRSLLVTAGALTVLAAGIMLIRQHDLKRMWAYSSVEHVGLMTLAIGLGAGPLFVLHALNHSVVKVGLFLLAGSIMHCYGTKSLKKIGGMLKASPMTGTLLFAGAFAIAGSPPFGVFISEWLLLRNTFGGGQIAAGIAVLMGLTVTFIAIASHVSRAAFGPLPPERKLAISWRWSAVPCALLLISLLAGFAVNPSVMRLLEGLVAQGGAAR